MQDDKVVKFEIPMLPQLDRSRASLPAIIAATD